MSVIRHFAVPALLASLFAPQIGAVLISAEPERLVEMPQLANLILLPLIVGGLLVFVLPIQRVEAIHRSAFLFTIVAIFAGALGGFLLGLLALLIAGGGHINLGPLFGAAALFGGVLGGVSALIWAMFNVRRKAA